MDTSWDYKLLILWQKKETMFKVDTYISEQIPKVVWASDKLW